MADLPTVDDVQGVLHPLYQKGYRAALEDAAHKVREDCVACNNGVFGMEPDGTAIECEYCGRPIQSIRALADKPTDHSER